MPSRQCYTHVSKLDSILIPLNQTLRSAPSPRLNTIKILLSARYHTGIALLCPYDIRPLSTSDCPAHQHHIFLFILYCCKDIGAIEIVKALVYVVCFVLVLIGLNEYIEGIVDKKISDPRIIEKVKAQVRPMVVFNQNGSILVDTGGMQYIESIRVILDQKKKTPQEIIITPKICLTIAPILESFDDDFVINSERGEKFQWIYKLGAISRILKQGSARSKGINRFRLEIIK